MSSPEMEAVLREATAAYEREDQGWFNSQTTEVLSALWSIACDIDVGAAWDDEVYEALALRGFFKDDSTAESWTCPRCVSENTGPRADGCPNCGWREE